MTTVAFKYHQHFACLLLWVVLFVSGCRTESTKKEQVYYLVEMNDTIGYHQDGIWNFLDRNGKLTERGAYKDGRRVGKWEGFYWNGNLSWRGEFHAFPERKKSDRIEKPFDLQDTADIIWGDSDHIADGEEFGEVSFSMSRWGQTLYEGLWEYYDTNGSLTLTEMYNKGRLVWKKRAE
jgi:antitoxin component YwqK of YwqJK toxin-antitoxin module